MIYVKYSLGINSDLFKYFNGIICRKSGCYASRNKLRLFFRVFFSTLSKSYSFSKEALLEASSATQPNRITQRAKWDAT